jgi:maltose alpha-D-glucosyltransferase/alpha-amylase
MGLYLTEVARYANCAPLAGVLEYIANDGQCRLLAMLQAYVANQGDGWTYSVDYLRRHFEQYRTKPAGDSLPPDAHDAYLTLIRVLAVRTAELHRVLGGPTSDPAFSPRALTRKDIDSYRQRTLQEAQGALELLASSGEQLSAADRERAQAVLALRKQLMARIESSCTTEPAQGLQIRIHGDYHLAQVLVTRNDFIIIDFEGEPGRSLEERRAKHSPLRDVAGMLRSFSYVQQSALLNIAHTETESARLVPLAREWEIQVREAFLGAYDEAARGSGLYASLDSAHGLLGLFEVEKSFYELRYELGNRPAWAGIPLVGILNWAKQ